MLCCCSATHAFHHQTCSTGYLQELLFSVCALQDWALHHTIDSIPSTTANSLHYRSDPSPSVIYRACFNNDQCTQRSVGLDPRRPEFVSYTAPARGTDILQRPSPHWGSPADRTRFHEHHFQLTVDNLTEVLYMLWPTVEW